MRHCARSATLVTIGVAIVVENVVATGNGLIVPGGIGEIAVVRANSNLLFLRLCTRVVHVVERVAGLESRTIYLSHANRKGHTFKGFTAVESRVTYLGYAAWNGD